MSNIYNPPVSSGGSSVIDATRVKFTGSQSITASTTTTVNFNTIDFDPNGHFSTSTYLYTAPATGKYIILANLACTTSGQIQVIIAVNGTAVVVGPSILSTYATAFSDTIALNAGDTVAVQVYSSVGNTMDNGTGRTYASFIRIL